MIRRQDGFSLVELMVALAVFVFVIAAATGIFIPLMNQFKQQSKMAETNIEGIIGLEMLRIDLEHAGYGLPWYFQNSIVYAEAASAPASNYNDSIINPPAPRAILSGNNINYTNIVNGSDYLVIKSTVVARNDTAQEWSYIVRNADLTTSVKTWGSEDLSNNNRVIVINPKVSETKLRELVMDGGTFFTQYSVTAFPANFSPSQPSESYIIYGVDPDTNLRMPFNRADYFVSTSSVPTRCAPNTGVLEKVVVNQGDGNLTNFLPLLDCVADMQVAFGIDTTTPPDGTADCYTNDLGNVLAPLDASNIRNMVRDVRVYILAHEGQFDRYFTFNLATLNSGLNPPISCPTCIRVGEGNTRNCTGEQILGRDFDLSAITNWQNYRWKVYTIVVKPQNLR